MTGTHKQKRQLRGVQHPDVSRSKGARGRDRRATRRQEQRQARRLLEARHVPVTLRVRADLSSQRPKNQPKRKQRETKTHLSWHSVPERASGSGWTTQVGKACSNAGRTETKGDGFR